jgi:hypothetical protein
MEPPLLPLGGRRAAAAAEAQVRRAEGDKQARIRQAEAEAERAKLAGQAEATVNITKGEAQAKVVLVNAQAEAERTKLEGNAEAGVVLTKGEAEAKALAMRADAYKQFNEAAVIQTVLSMLPEIVRAAAEPMSNIGSLTVLSNDGASEVVRTATRTVTEAGATVKGLTGLDVPELISQAMGRDSNAAPAPRPSGSAPATASRPPTTSRPRGRGRDSTARRGGGSVEDHGGVDPQAAWSAALEQVDRAGASTPPVTPPPIAPSAPQATEEPSVVGEQPSIGRETTVAEALTRLAAELERVPGLERFRSTRLASLEGSGPRALARLWRAARSAGAEAYGDLTIGELLERYGSEGTRREH